MESLEDTAKRIERRRATRNKIDADIREMVASLQARCPHNTITAKEKYYEGGYDYKSYTVYTITCTTCGYTTTETEHHSF